MKSLPLVSRIIALVYLVLLIVTLLFFPVSQYKNHINYEYAFLLGGLQDHPYYLMRFDVLAVEIAALTAAAGAAMILTAILPNRRH